MIGSKQFYSIIHTRDFSWWWKWPISSSSSLCFRSLWRKLPSICFVRSFVYYKVKSSCMATGYNDIVDSIQIELNGSLQAWQGNLSWQSQLEREDCTQHKPATALYLYYVNNGKKTTTFVVAMPAGLLCWLCTCVYNTLTALFWLMNSSTRCKGRAFVTVEQVTWWFLLANSQI